MRWVIGTLKWLGIGAVALSVLGIGYYVYLVESFDTETLPANHGNVSVQLYVGDGERQPLLVGLGGSEGGNAWASNHWKAQRDRFLEQGYAFLAVGYFGMPGIPAEMDRISLDGVHAAIMEAAADSRINENCIAVIGGSKGAELALALASHFPSIKAVVAIVPGLAVFPAHTIAMSTSSFTLDGEPLPFVPVPWSAVPALIKGDLRAVWEEMLENEEAVARAAIAIERINGPILFLSATRDEFWPSAEMSERMMQRLRDHDFPYAFEHVAIDGDHRAPQRHPEIVEELLRKHFLSENALDCPRPAAIRSSGFESSAGDSRRL